jgi:hypothetical protein
MTAYGPGGGYVAGGLTCPGLVRVEVEEAEHAVHTNVDSSRLDYSLRTAVHLSAYDDERLQFNVMHNMFNNLC